MEKAKKELEKLSKDINNEFERGLKNFKRIRC